MSHPLEMMSRQLNIQDGIEAEITRDVKLGVVSMDKLFKVMGLSRLP